MTVVVLVLLAAGVLAAVAHLRRPALAVVPPVLAAVAVAVGGLAAGVARAAVGDLVEPLLFVLLAVPLAVLLDRAGCFGAVARRLPAGRTAVGLWVAGAATVALVNLDAAVVLLTPVAIRAAGRSGEDARGLALQPVLLAALSSSWLPASNLTNLIAEEDGRSGPVAFLVHLGLPSLAAVGVGYVLWRRAWPRPVVPEPEPGPGSAGPAPPPVRRDVDPVDDGAALVLAAVVGVTLLVGFTVGGAVGIPPWAVAAVVVAGLGLRAGAVPLAAVPWTSALVVAGLAVLAVAAAEHVAVDAALGTGRGPAGMARVVAVGALAANATNNLPAFVAGLPHLPAGDGVRWAWLLGVNAGPTVLVTGSLAGLLWLDVARRSGLDVGARDVARAGLRIGLPALVAATAVLVLTV
ncbi:citrate transporter [Iamia sp. SCSIO 61187]|uniref:hypothetical protein n=1 Tax=Iamia sp. SCSIO 61187 TaxID=2722752 RepID=UPI001C628AA7|nr:hypothetical protein [Iamia sp. SCSIO 61187]QYG91500.1 citrate transporter [Iamia sp. SCSIO 61187]